MGNRNPTRKVYNSLDDDDNLTYVNQVYDIQHDLEKLSESRDLTVGSTGQAAVEI